MSNVHDTVFLKVLIIKSFSKQFTKMFLNLDIFTWSPFLNLGSPLLSYLWKGIYILGFKS